MKLAFSTLSFDEWGFEEYVKICKKYGFDGIEIRMGSGIGTLEYTEEELARYKKLLDDNGLAVTDLGSSVCIRDNDDALYEAFAAHLPLAKALGAAGIRVFMGTFKTYRYEPNNPMSFEGSAALLQRLCDAAAPYGVSVYIETHNEFATGKELARLLAAVGRDNCKIIWDIMHPLEEGETPQETMDYLGDRIAHIHIKDGTKDPNPEAISYVYGPIGEGEMPVEEIVSVLKKAGFDGYYSLEWEEKWRQSLQEAALPHEVVLENYARFMKQIDEKTKGACQNA